MRNKYKWYSILLLGLSLLLASSLTACGQRGVDEETQEVLDFMEDLKPIAEANNQLAADFNDFGMNLTDVLPKMGTLNEAETEALKSQISAELKGLIKRASDTYIEIGQLDVPLSCKTVQYKWKETYEYYIQGFQSYLSCFATGDSDACDKGDKLVIKANQCVTEAKYELNEVARAHGIEMQWK